MEFSVRGPVTDVESAWALIGDTDLLATLAGSPSVRMTIARDEHDYPEVTGTFVGPSILRHPFVEPDSRWVHHRWFELVRRMNGPLMKEMRYHAHLETVDGGVVPHIDFRVDFMNTVASWMGRPNVIATERAWNKAFASLPAPNTPAPKRILRSLPASVERTLEAWARGTDSALVDRVRSHFTTERAPDLARLRPFALADDWGLDRDTVLIAFLEGVLSGALELVWVSRCPRCDASVSTSDSLSNLADHAECVSCRIGFSPSLDEDVEVVFAAPEVLRPAPGVTFCTLYPVDRPEVRMLLTLAPGTEETVHVPLVPGSWMLGCGGDRPDQPIVIHRDGRTTHRWTPDAHAPVQVRAGELALTLHNPTEGRLRVQLAGTADRAGVVSAARLATYPGYTALFGPQSLATDVRLSVRAVAILFTDLSGSTAIYEAHGDGKAFSIVHAHFGILEEALEANGGTRVKTIGDAVMAAFTEPLAAIRAGIAMQRAFSAWAATLDVSPPPGLRVGIHFGPAMVVHTDQAGLDYFGGTVNLAARTEGQAKPGQVVWTRAVHEAPGVAEVLTHDAISFEAFAATVKGIERAVDMVRTTPV